MRGRHFLCVRLFTPKLFYDTIKGKRAAALAIVSNYPALVDS